jgi:hypothetical protein
MNNLPKIFPGYCIGRAVYNPSGMNPIANGYSSASINRPFGYEENQVQQRCAISPNCESIIIFKK